MELSLGYTIYIVINFKFKCVGLNILKKNTPVSPKFISNVFCSEIISTHKKLLERIKKLKEIKWFKKNKL